MQTNSEKPKSPTETQRDGATAKTKSTTEARRHGEDQNQFSLQRAQRSRATTKTILYHRGHRGTRRIIWATKERECTRIRKRQISPRRNSVTEPQPKPTTEVRRHGEDQNQFSPERTQRSTKKNSTSTACIDRGRLSPFEDRGFLEH